MVNLLVKFTKIPFFFSYFTNTCNKHTQLKTHTQTCAAIQNHSNPAPKSSNPTHKIFEIYIAKEYEVKHTCFSFKCSTIKRTSTNLQELAVRLNVAVLTPQ